MAYPPDPVDIKTRSPFECGTEFVVAGETLTCERPPGHLGGHACPSAVARPPSPEVWLLRLHDNKLSYHSYKDEATREKWAVKYRARGDRVSYDHFIRGATAE